ncbi:MAG: hypothetical protein H0W83_04880 [Planctomycetes bacterium]|nr:hypothetical protein [Planctomycetota bacterium]
MIISRPVRFAPTLFLIATAAHSFAQDWPLNDAVDAGGSRVSAGRIVVLDQIGSGAGSGYLRRITAPPVSPKARDRIAALSSSSHGVAHPSNQNGTCGLGAGAIAIALGCASLLSRRLRPQTPATLCRRSILVEAARIVA